MLEEGRISEAELVSMMMFTVLGTAYFTLPSVAAGFAGRDLWLVPMLAMGPGLLVAWACSYLGTRFPGFNYFNWIEILLGTAGGKILQFLYVLWFIDVTESLPVEFASFMNTAFLPSTSPLMLTALLLVLSGVAVYGGAEIIGRMSLIFLPVSLVIFLGLFALGAGLYDFSNLRPLLERGLMPVLVGSLPVGAWQGEVLLGAMFFPFLVGPDRGGRVLTRALLWIGLLLFVDSLVLDLTFGGETARLSQPLFNLAREINLLSFFQHLETFVLISWVASIFVKLSVWYYVVVLGLGQWLNLEKYRPLVLPCGLLMLALAAYNWPNAAMMHHFFATIVPFYSGGTFEFAIPALLAVLALVRERIRKLHPA